MRSATGLLTIDPDGVVTPLASSNGDRPVALEGLLAQEVDLRRNGHPSPRVVELMDRFGFEFEPWAEPGHVRMQPWASRMHACAQEHARRHVQDIARVRGLPFDEVSGVLVVDTRAAALADYLDLIHDDGSLYGAEPYALGGTRAGVLLRQTACLQKFAIAAEWDMGSTPLPRCLFEVSDSFRGETDEDVEQLFRVRRFRLPEAHLHDRSFEAALDGARELHRRLSLAMADLDADHVILVSASHRTWQANAGTIAAMVAETARWALVLVSPPGALCQDGIELDFEYKFLDVNGFPRELATFQLDTRITRAIGLSVPDGELTTTHVVPTGSVERLIHAHLDRVARLERAGRRVTLPYWLAPVTVRLLESPDAWRAGGEVAARAVEHGLRVEVDDRPVELAEKIAAADECLVPFTLTPSGDTGRVRVREYESRVEEDRDAATWLATVACAPSMPSSVPSIPRLSQRPTRAVASTVGAPR
ncbi:MAG: hypothetical protein ACRDSK_06645 [Actinophytocola sp.]|uniref:hypothetical protein n=1 Tax=Actinophytocola sp. TaxID=1872138 RepID=UPI003D6B4B38